MPIETATTITMPQLGESVTEGTLGAWLKQIGERVEKFDPLVEVETDKVSSEIPSPVAGVLVEILIESDSTVPVGTVICRIDESGSANGSPRVESQTETSVDDTPSVSQNGVISPNHLNGNGKFTSRREGSIPDEM